MDLFPQGAARKKLSSRIDVGVACAEVENGFRRFYWVFYIWVENLTMGGKKLQIVRTLRSLVMFPAENFSEILQKFSKKVKFSSQCIARLNSKEVLKRCEENSPPAALSRTKLPMRSGESSSSYLYRFIISSSSRKKRTLEAKMHFNATNFSSKNEAPIGDVN